MGVTLFTEVGYTLAKLVDSIEMGEIGLPEIQRPFVWPNTKVRDLFDSMYRGFPVGYLLFWANGTGGGHKQIGADAKQKVPHLLIVDGQQRLTSLYAVLKGIEVVREDYRSEHIRIAFAPLTGKFEVTDAAIQRDPEYIPDISLVWSDKTDIFDLAENFIARLKEARPVSVEEQKAIKKAINSLDNLSSYPFTALEISSGASEEEVADVFVRINSKGTPLNQADFILTLMSVFWDEGRTELEQFCRRARIPAVSGPSPYNYYSSPDPDQLLRVCVGLGFRRARLTHVYSILRGKDLDTEQYSDERREQQFGVLRSAQKEVLDLQNWHDFLLCLKQAGYASQAMISSQNALMYSYALYLVGARDFQMERHTLRKVIARWFSMVSLTGRYTGSFESIMEQDLGRLRGISTAAEFLHTLDSVIADTFTSDYWTITLPNELATSSSRSPSLFAYYAALNLLQARVLFSHMHVSELLDPTIKAKRSAIERHHLFPRGYLNTLGVTEIRDTNQIANFALVEWDDNTSIRDAAPSVYYPKYACRFSDEEMERMAYWHALPAGWPHMGYQEFLEARRKLMAQVIADGFKRLPD